jgi:hypothetical protein
MHRSAGQNSSTIVRKRFSAPFAGSVAATSKPFARKLAAQLAPITPVPTTAILPDIGVKPIFKLHADETRTKTLLSIGPGASPRYRRDLERTIQALWSEGAQLKRFASHLNQAHLPLSEPIREEAYSHLM